MLGENTQAPCRTNPTEVQTVHHNVLVDLQFIMTSIKLNGLQEVKNSKSWGRNYFFIVLNPICCATKPQKIIFVLFAFSIVVKNERKDKRSHFYFIK